MQCVRRRSERAVLKVDSKSTKSERFKFEPEVLLKSLHNYQLHTAGRDLAVALWHWVSCLCALLAAQ